MGDPYEKVKGGRLSFKGGGGLATLSKSIHKKKKNKKKTNQNRDEQEQQFPLDEAEDKSSAGGGGEGSSAAGGGGEGEIVYTIDAAKRMKYDELFPVEAKKFAYDPKSAHVRSVEDALDDRVKKKADRYCK